MLLAGLATHPSGSSTCDVSSFSSAPFKCGGEIFYLVSLRQDFKETNRFSLKDFYYSLIQNFPGELRNTIRTPCWYQCTRIPGDFRANSIRTPASHPRRRRTWKSSCRIYTASVLKSVSDPCQSTNRWFQKPCHVMRCAFPVARTHANKIQKMQIQILTNTGTYRRHTHTHTYTHTHTHWQTPIQKHMQTTPSES